QQCNSNNSKMDYMDHRKQLDMFIGILLQTAVKRWGLTGNCKCDYMDKLNCVHSHKYSIMCQHFSDKSHQTIIDLLDFLEAITTQTCDCHYHAQLPLHGPSKYIKEPIPTFEQMRQLHQEIAPEISPEEMKKCYVDAIVSWIYARLFLYMTPYIDPIMLKRVSTSGFYHSNCLELEFSHAERNYLEQQIYLQGQDVDYAERLEKLNQLAGLKKTYCRNRKNKEDREAHLLNKLRLP
ncbi:MAG: hypothetical protein MJE68_10905, partial [Proteobacteria bacterium]|nr:hypothetical protein [Pseudomonadota bacterium]